VDTQLEDNDEHTVVTAKSDESFVARIQAFPLAKYGLTRQHDTTTA